MKLRTEIAELVGAMEELVRTGGREHADAVVAEAIENRHLELTCAVCGGDHPSDLSHVWWPEVVYPNAWVPSETP